MIYKTISILLLSNLTILFLLTALNAQDLVKEKKVIDGDTLLLTNGEKVRLIGVDTPKMDHPQKSVERFAKKPIFSLRR